jgi:uncharacterized membrane protein YkvI
MQFFGVFGKMGVVGMFLSVALFGVFGYIFMDLVKREGRTAIDQIIMGEGKTILHRFLNAISLFFLFGVTVIMLAGAGSLLNELLGIPYFIGGAVLTVVLAVLSLKGMKGVLAITQMVVPVLLVLVVIVALVSLFLFEPAKITAADTSAGNPLLGNWFLATITFFSYNILASLAVLAPAAQRTRDMKTVAKGIIQGAVQLLMMIAGILISMQRFYGYIADADFPMQALAEKISPMFGVLYAVLLLAAMFSGSLACMYGAAVQLFGEKEQKKSAMLALWAVAFLCSMVGLKELISFIFPVCGYAYLIAMPITLWRYAKVRRAGK